jgi:hypothetical protein
LGKGGLQTALPILEGSSDCFPTKGDLMVIFFSVVLKDLLERGRDYPWPKPAVCPRCGACRLCGHGYVGCFFDGFQHALLIKRYRCPDCRCVIRCRPNGYFKRFQAPIDTIRESISSKAQRGCWLKGISRCRQSHWWQALKRHIEAFFGHTFGGTRLEGFELLLSLGRSPVCRTI